MVPAVYINGFHLYHIHTWPKRRHVVHTQFLQQAQAGSGHAGVGYVGTEVPVFLGEWRGSRAPRASRVNGACPLVERLALETSLLQELLITSSLHLPVHYPTSCLDLDAHVFVYYI